MALGHWIGLCTCLHKSLVEMDHEHLAIVEVDIGIGDKCDSSRISNRWFQACLIGM